MPTPPLLNPFALAPQRLAQVINPLNWLASGTGQIGLVNISGAASTKPEVEADIVENVATYGRQLGRISDVLDAVLAHMHADAWDGEDAQCLRAFREMNAKIAAVKAGYLAPTQQNVNQLIAGINSLKDTDHDEYVRIKDELRKRLFGDER
jgi:hypothetical protein